MRRLLAMVVCGALLASAGCTRAPSTRPARPSQSGAAYAAEVAVARDLPASGTVEKNVPSPLADGQVSLGIDIYRRLSAASEGNIVVSPLSLSVALAMTANGAQGETRDQMEQVLGVDAFDRPTSNAAYADLLRNLGERKETTISVANALWADSAEPLNRDFLARDRDFFGAQLARMSFSDKESVATTINAWVSDQTHGRIPKLLEAASIDPATVMELVNTVYFKGAWEEPFRSEATTRGAFFLNGRRPSRERRAVRPLIEVPTMHRSGMMDYLETDDFQAVRLPYRGGVDMWILLPKEGVDLATFEDAMTLQRWNVWASGFTPTLGSLALPKFAVRAQAELKPQLQKMGMVDAFSAGADFGDMSSDQLRISRVDHSVYVDVDESGTEAAGATAVTMEKSEMTPGGGRAFKMPVDRPFFFAIVDRPTGVPLFLGSVLDPRER